MSINGNILASYQMWCGVDNTLFAHAWRSDIYSHSHPYRVCYTLDIDFMAHTIVSGYVTFIWHIVTFTHPGNYFIDIIQFRNSCTFVSSSRGTSSSCCRCFFLRLSSFTICPPRILQRLVRFDVRMLLHNSKKANDSLFYVERCWRSLFNVEDMQKRHTCTQYRDIHGRWKNTKNYEKMYPF